MKLTNIVLFSALGFGVCHAAGTTPCNGFKIDLKNHTNQQIVIDKVLLRNGTMTSVDPQLIEVNKTSTYTVGSTIENAVMEGEFLVHTLGQQKELRINFNLTNANLVCELSNTMQQGSLHTSFDRVPGGVILPIKE